MKSGSSLESSSNTNPFCCFNFLPKKAMLPFRFGLATADCLVIDGEAVLLCLCAGGVGEDLEGALGRGRFLHVWIADRICSSVVTLLCIPSVPQCFVVLPERHNLYCWQRHPIQDIASPLHQRLWIPPHQSPLS